MIKLYPPLRSSQISLERQSSFPCDPGAHCRFRELKQFEHSSSYHQHPKASFADCFNVRHIFAYYTASICFVKGFSPSLRESSTLRRLDDPGAGCPGRWPALQRSGEVPVQPGGGLMKPYTHSRWIGLVLRWGAYGSALLLAVGIGGWLLFEPDIPMQIGPPIPLKHLWTQLLQRNPYAVLQLGILALLATPPLSILVAATTFARSKEYLYVSFCILLLIACALALLLLPAP